jgi:hypothetical protein
MSEKKINREHIEKMLKDKVSGKVEDKGLPLRIPSQSLVNGNGNNPTSTSTDVKKIE